MFSFAWVGASETAFDPAVHGREDEDVFSLSIDHSEGDFAMLSVEIRNPRRRLLAGPSIWVWLSHNGQPLFFGRLVAIPASMEAELVRLNFIARPVGFAEAKRALAETLRVAPFWDPVWIAPERVDDPDTVLEARPEIWHIDRLTHAVSVSSIISGEDGLLDLAEGDFAYDSLDVQYGAAPVRRVRVEAEVSWNQTAEGQMDISALLRSAFGGAIASFTGQGLEADWPREGANLRGGWEVARSELYRLDGVSRSIGFKDVAVTAVQPAQGEAGSRAEDIFAPPVLARFYRWEFGARMLLGYSASRQRIELARFTLAGGVQRVFSEPGDEEELILSLASQRVVEPIDAGGAMPLRVSWAPAYFRTSRGMDSLGYLVSLARAKMLARARAVKIEVAVPLATALGLSCRMSARITDPRLPGGSAVGKVSAYRIVASGDGAQYGIVTVACTIGTGGAVEPLAGEPSWSDGGYSSGYEAMAGQTFDVVPGEVTIGSLDGVPIADDGIDFGAMTPAANVRRLEVTNGPSEQAAVLSARFPDVPAAVEALNAKHTRVWLDLRPLAGGPFVTEYPVAVSDLTVPMTMEL